MLIGIAYAVRKNEAEMEFNCVYKLILLDVWKQFRESYGLVDFQIDGFTSSHICEKKEILV